MSIEKHVFADLALSAEEVNGVIKIEDQITGEAFGLTRSDIHALAKHFGLIDEWVSVHDKKPPYGKPILLKINGVVQNITYNLYGSDDSLDWFEPYSNIGAYDDYNELSFFVEHDVDVEWRRLPAA